MKNLCKAGFFICQIFVIVSSIGLGQEIVASPTIEVKILKGIFIFMAGIFPVCFFAYELARAIGKWGMKDFRVNEREF